MGTFKIKLCGVRGHGAGLDVPCVHGLEVMDSKQWMFSVSAVGEAPVMSVSCTLQWAEIMGSRWAQMAVPGTGMYLTKLMWPVAFNVHTENMIGHGKSIHVLGTSWSFTELLLLAIMLMYLWAVCSPRQDRIQALVKGEVTGSYCACGACVQNFQTTPTAAREQRCGQYRTPVVNRLVCECKSCELRVLQHRPRTFFEWLLRTISQKLRIQ